MSSTFYTTLPNGYVEPRTGDPKDLKDPYASKEPRTVIEAFQDRVERTPDENAMALKRKIVGSGNTLPKNWKFWTWKQYYNDCCKFAKTLLHLQCKPFSIINVLGFNSPEWLLSNNGAILASCIVAGIYNTNQPDACRYISEHSRAELVVVEGNTQLEKYREIAKQLPNLKAIVVWGEIPNPAVAKDCGVVVYDWETFLQLGTSAGVTDKALEERQLMARPGNCCTLIYTSGTTGSPKAVMVSHDNVTWTTSVLADNYLDLNHTDRIVSFLPLSHIAAQIIDIHVPILVGACTYFAQPDALKGSLTASLNDARPTFFFGVPRVWEKIQEKMVELGRSNPKIMQMLSGWAKKKGLQKAEMAQFGASGENPWCFGCANILLRKIKEKLGLGDCKMCFTGAAPISKDTLWYFASLGIPIYEVFGQSECTGPQTVATSDQWKVGTTGRPLVGTESRIFLDGELGYRGRHIFMGYMYMEQETRDTIDADGFLHSGDVAVFDNDADKRIRKGPAGFMTITGRKKELIITAGGENIPPVLIENAMKSAMLAVSNVMCIGDERKFLTMLVSIKTTADATGAPTATLAADALFEGKRIGSSAKTLAEAAVDPLWREYFDTGMRAGNSAATSKAQHVQKWVLLPEDFSEAGGTLTPTLKLKRREAGSRYTELIEGMYA